MQTANDARALTSTRITDRQRGHELLKAVSSTHYSAKKQSDPILWPLTFVKRIRKETKHYPRFKNHFGFVFFKKDRIRITRQTTN